MAKILEICSYPPPRSGWGVRVQYLKQYLEAQGHTCVVLNTGSSRRIPSHQYETVLSGRDYLRKVIRYTRAGFTSHLHANGASPKGLVLAFVAAVTGLLWGLRPFLTFHAGIEQVYFPRHKAPLWTPVFRLLFTLPRAIICNSEEVKARIVAYGVNADKIFPIAAFSAQYLSRAPVDLPPELAGFFAKHLEVVFSYIRFRPLFYPVEVVRGFAKVAETHLDVGLLLCGVSDHMEPGLDAAVRQEIAGLGLSDRVLIVDDLDHDTFLEALSRATVYLRSHVSDGVCSSVLEALSLGIPVVASENGTRPPGVVTYPAADSTALADLLAQVLASRDTYVARLSQPVSDTLSLEASLLTSGSVPVSHHTP